MLYPGSIVTSENAALYLISFCHRFSLSKYASKELLQLCHYILPLGNNLPKSFNKLNESVGLDKIILKKKDFAKNVLKNFSKSNRLILAKKAFGNAKNYLALKKII